MKQSRGFAYLTLADFIVRAAYQMGKTPLLPIFAATLGATDAYLGFIVSISTLTGMVLKPLIGLLSDRWGRLGWLIVGTIFFTTIPFVYRFVSTPEQLVFVRIIHGLSTAIYGPVTLAYIAEQSSQNQAERLGWFGMARSAGSVVGPAAAGWLLLTMEPVLVFTVIGMMSSLAFLPILLLPKPTHVPKAAKLPLKQHMRQAVQSWAQTPAVWLSGGLESAMYVATYAVRAFLPIYALSLGVNVALVGAFFALQEIVHMVTKPMGGRLGDRFGYLQTIALGLLGLGIALPLLTYTYHNFLFATAAILIGLAQALITSSAVALVAITVPEANMGASLGFIGTMKNGGKVIGPILAGGLIYWLDFRLTFQLMSIIIIIGAVGIWVYTTFQPKSGRRTPRHQAHLS
ncbi:MAG: MFS transporter [Chloroflexota bacterium]